MTLSGIVRVIALAAALEEADDLSAALGRVKRQIFQGRSVILAKAIPFGSGTPSRKNVIAQLETRSTEKNSQWSQHSCDQQSSR